MKDENEGPDFSESVTAFMVALMNALAEVMEQRQGTRRRLVDMDQAAEYLAMSEDTVFRMVGDKKLVPVRLDRRMRFDIRDLDKLIADAKRSSR